jgi:hypothetical protein
MPITRPVNSCTDEEPYGLAHRTCPQQGPRPLFGAQHMIGKGMGKAVNNLTLHCGMG